MENLLTAAENETNEKIYQLLDSGCNVNLRDKFGKTALMIAAEKGNFLATLGLLLGGKADTKLKDTDGNTALDLARRSLDRLELKTNSNLCARLTRIENELLKWKLDF